MRRVLVTHDDGGARAVQVFPGRDRLAYESRYRRLPRRVSVVVYYESLSSSA